MMSSGKHGEPLERALDSALERVLTPPRMPAHFRHKLRAAIARADDLSITAMRSRVEQEQRARLAQLRRDYVQLRRRTLGMMIGGAFAAGAGAAVALPWLTAEFGPMAPVVIASTGTIIGFAIGIYSWLKVRGEADARSAED